MNRITTFLREVRGELNKVSWPTRDQLIQYTIAVLAVSIFLAIFLGLLDFGFSSLINKYIVR